MLLFIKQANSESVILQPIPGHEVIPVWKKALERDGVFCGDRDCQVCVGGKRHRVVRAWTGSRVVYPEES